MDEEIKSALKRLQSLYNQGLIEEIVYIDRQKQLVQIYTGVSVEDPSLVDVRDILDFIEENTPQSGETSVETGIDGQKSSKSFSSGSVRSSTDVVLVKDFDDLDFTNELLRGIYAYGFEKPSVIQQSVIVPISQGRDVVAQALSGSGKTAAFLIGMLARIDITLLAPQGIIVAPSRDLALQIVFVLKVLSEYIEGFEIGTAIGGTSVKECAKKFRKGVHVVVGTPGRISQMISSKILATSDLKTIVFDEGDELLSRSLLDQIQNIFTRAPAEIQAVVIGTTLPEGAMRIIEKFIRNPVNVLIDDKHILSNRVGMNHLFVDVQLEDYKLDTLEDLFTDISDSGCVVIIFCNTNRKAEWVADELDKAGYLVSVSHGELSQQERENTLGKFRQGFSRVLITTNTLSRGIDIPQVSLVINFDMPNNGEVYVHRSGRTGRFSRKGTVISFVTTDQNLLEEIEEQYNITISPLPLNWADLL